MVKVIKIVILSILVIFLVGILVFQDKINFSFVTKYDYLVLDTEISAQDIENIDIESTRLEIFKSETDEFRIIERASKEINEDKKIVIETNNNTLKIKNPMNRIGFNILNMGTVQTKIELYIPEKIYNKVSLKTLSGGISLEELNCNNFDAKLTSGDVEIKDLQAKDATFDLTSGSIKIDNIVANELMLLATSGQMKVKGKVENILDINITSGTVDVETSVLTKEIESTQTSGKIKISIPENDGFKLKYNLTSGDIDSDFELDNDIGKKGTARYKDGEKNIVVNMTSGTFSLKKK
ncbi:MAG: DUF4097 domain-containing protein [Lachnospiraceae bacterium]|jgi:DUF4097 and DUF4098 domain-containing protein YvlB|nr:DUF4097 domain-containing protein [Lachnospiraceae bacterium]